MDQPVSFWRWPLKGFGFDSGAGMSFLLTIPHWGAGAKTLCWHACWQRFWCFYNGCWDNLDVQSWDYEETCVSFCTGFVTQYMWPQTSWMLCVNCWGLHPYPLAGGHFAPWSVESWQECSMCMDLVHKWSIIIWWCFSLHKVRSIIKLPCCLTEQNNHNAKLGSFSRWVNIAVNCNFPLVWQSFGKVWADLLQAMRQTAIFMFPWHSF